TSRNILLPGYNSLLNVKKYERELTAEAGLCVVVPCSFTTGVGFTPKHIVWYKCEASQKLCSEPDIIFHSNKITDKKAQAEFEGRVSRLEPDVTQKNCSIIINELKESDSGSYQFRVTGELNGKQDGFTFIPRVTVSVKGEKSYFKDNHVEKEDICSLMIPTLTEGQQATLTCTAPGLCSGSVPEITWTWRGAGGTESYITGNSTNFKTENLVDFTQRHISTLTFNASSEHHNTSITCKINFTCGKTTEETLTVNVNCGYFITYYKKEITISGVTTVKEGDVLNLTCSVESFPPSVIVWSKLGSDTKLHNDNGSATLVISNATAEHSGQYICAVTYMNNSLKKDISVTVICKYTIFLLLSRTFLAYSVITSVSNHTVNSTVSVTIKNHGNSTVECVSNNGNGEVRENLLVNNNLSKKDGKFCLVVAVVLN
uniref:B-cell receptor CD22 n=1 Tax=Astatotilapia calliptera TaxID=8154 RepID=A0A3P8NES3_ASTCA